VSGKRCLDCGGLYAPATDSALCQWCRAEHNRFRTRAAKLVEAERRGDLGRAGSDDPDRDEKLRAERDRLRPVPVPGSGESAETSGRWVTYAVGNSRLGALRQVFVPAAAKRDRWGKPLR